MGGAATQTGINYQNRVAAWIAVRILAEQEASLPWNLAAKLTFEFLFCETGQPVDDILLGLSDGFAFIQAKHTLTLQTGADSDLASALDQFIRQFLANKNNRGTRPWERPLSAQLDRLVFVTGPHSSGPIKTQLPAILSRVHALRPEQALNDAATNQPELHALTIILGHLRRSFRNATGSDPNDHELRQILSLIRVFILDIDPGGMSEDESKNLLRRIILKDPTQVDLAWDNLLTNSCAGFAASKSGADRSRLQTLLSIAGIVLKIPFSYRDDIDKLLCFSRSMMDLLSDLSKIQVGSTAVKIKRKCTKSLKEVAEINSVVVVGEPGAGKSGALHDLIEILFEEGRDVIFFAVDKLDARSCPSLQKEIGLSRDLIEILKNWLGDGPGFLVVDALNPSFPKRLPKPFGI